MFLVIFLAIVAVIAVIIHFLTNRMFLDASNVKIILSNAVSPTFIGWALCFLFACGFTDLSLGSVVVLGAFGSAILGAAWGYPGVVAGGLVIGVVLVFINFFIFAFAGIPSWIASISLALIYEAVAVWMRNTEPMKTTLSSAMSTSLMALGQFPINIILMVIGFVVIYFVYNRTAVGLDIRAIGGNMTVSKVLGVNVVKTLLYVGLISGILVGIAAIIKQSESGLVPASSGMASLQIIYKPLAIALLAQVLQNRINIMVAVPICSILIFAIFNFMTFFGVPSGTLQDVFLGAFIIIFGAAARRGTKEVVK